MKWELADMENATQVDPAAIDTRLSGFCGSRRVRCSQNLIKNSSSVESTQDSTRIELNSKIFRLIVMQTDLSEGRDPHSSCEYSSR